MAYDLILTDENDLDMGFNDNDAIISQGLEPFVTGDGSTDTYQLIGPAGNNMVHVRKPITLTKTNILGEVELSNEAHTNYFKHKITIHGPGSGNASVTKTSNDDIFGKYDSWTCSAQADPNQTYFLFSTHFSNELSEGDVVTFSFVLTPLAASKDFITLRIQSGAVSNAYDSTISIPLVGPTNHFKRSAHAYDNLFTDMFQLDANNYLIKTIAKVHSSYTPSLLLAMVDDGDDFLTKKVGPYKFKVSNVQYTISKDRQNYIPPSKAAPASQVDYSLTDDGELTLSRNLATGAQLYWSGTAFIEDQRKLLRLGDGAERIKQQIRVTLQTLLGEWFLDTSWGVPVFDKILVKSPRRSQIESIIRSKIVDVPGVTRVKEMRIQIDNKTRKAVISIPKIETDNGDIGVTVNHG